MSETNEKPSMVEPDAGESEDHMVKKDMTTKRILQEIMREPALRLKVTALGLIAVTLFGTGLALAIGFFISWNGYFEFPRVVDLALYGFIIAIGVCPMLLAIVISQFKKQPLDSKLELMGLICCAILTGVCGVMFCWYRNPPGYLPRAIIGISAGCLLIVATLLMLADASGITLTPKSQKLINRPIKDPKGLLLKIIELALITTCVILTQIVVKWAYTWNEHWKWFTYDKWINENITVPIISWPPYGTKPVSIPWPTPWPLYYTYEWTVKVTVAGFFLIQCFMIMARVIKKPMSFQIEGSILTIGAVLFLTSGSAILYQEYHPLDFPFIYQLLNISSFMDEDDNDTEQMKNIINVSKSLGFLCLVNGLVMFGDAVNTIKVGLGQEFSLHLSFGNQRIFKEPVGVFNLIALVTSLTCTVLTTLFTNHLKFIAREDWNPWRTWEVYHNWVVLMTSAGFLVAIFTLTLARLINQQVAPQLELIILSIGAVMFAASGFVTIDEVTSHPIATYTNRTFIIRIVALCFTTGLVMLIGTVLTSIKIWKDYQKSKIELQDNKTETNFIWDSLGQSMSGCENQKQNPCDSGSSDEELNKEPENIATKPSTVLHA